MTREEQINTLTAIIQECEDYQYQRKETLFEIIKVLEQEPCEDAVSRQVALDLCERFDGCVPYSVLSNHDMLPSVTPR